MGLQVATAMSESGTRFSGEAAVSETMSGTERQTRFEQGSPVIFSVIIPTRNRSRLLKEAIESLWAQTLDARKYEVLVVDNCSTDETAELMRDLQLRSPCRLIYHLMPSNRGPVHSRNTAARLAQGEFIAFTDDDCRVVPEWLERAIEAFGTAPNIAFATGPILNKPEQPVRFFSRTNGEVTEEHPSYPACNAFYRRAIFLKMGGFDESLGFKDVLGHVLECADTDLAWRVKESGYANVFAKDSKVYHEAELLGPWAWTLLAFRLCILPPLVKRHPLLRTRLLYWRLFFLKQNALFYLAGLGVLLAMAAHWAFLSLAFPYIIWVTLFFRSTISFRRMPKFLAQVVLFSVRQGVLAAGLVYGSVRHRSLVL
jgi:glycosyltransferase involved in cell wall biosynthesis